jgi:transposase-like protein
MYSGEYDVCDVTLTLWVRDAGTGGGGAGGAAAPVALYQEGKGGKGALSI